MDIKTLGTIAAGILLGLGIHVLAKKIGLGG
jgi:hypothetical protein